MVDFMLQVYHHDRLCHRCHCHSRGWDYQGTHAQIRILRSLVIWRSVQRSQLSTAVQMANHFLLDILRALDFLAIIVYQAASTSVVPACLC